MASRWRPAPGYRCMTVHPTFGIDKIDSGVEQVLGRNGDTMDLSAQLC